MKDSFYSAFENKYRGSRELIKSRLQVYIPIISTLHLHFSDAIALDLGCGRGEWLEIVRSLGFKEQGVDLDDGMLMYCHEHNLNAEKKNALDILQELPDNSVTLVSSFHLVEHIGFDNVNTLVCEALRVLKPGGLLIIETPNPENIIVSSNNFFLDPTHDKPIPRQLLSFLTEYAGFERTKILRLQDDKALENQEYIELFDVLGGVSPDYSIVAQKQGEQVLMKEFDDFFSSSYGISLEFLAKKYHEGLDSRFKKVIDDICIMHQTLDNLNVVNEDIEEKIQKLEVLNSHMAEKIDNKINEKFNEISINEQILNKLFSCQKELSDMAELLSAMRNSTSWRITSPLRALGRIIKGESGVPIVTWVIKNPIKLVGGWTVNYFNRNPRIRLVFFNLLKKVGLYNKLRYFYQKLRIAPNAIKTTPLDSKESDILDAKLSSYGKAILNKLNR